jgi:rhodanese-related sulfurtransferase
MMRRKATQKAGVIVMEKWSDVDPKTFIELLRSGELSPGQVIDVREPAEWDYYHLDQTTLIPMNTIPQRLQELPRDKPLYILCAHGVRSVAVCRYLQERGFDGLRNVAGGMAAVASFEGFQYD